VEDKVTCCTDDEITVMVSFVVPVLES